MQCWKVLTNVQFDEGRKSCFVIESGEYFNFLDSVTDEIGHYKVSASTMRDFIDWVQGKRGPFVLLVSLDLQFATLRETFSGGEFKLEPGEELLHFWKWPIQGGVEKYAAVLDREIGLLPEVCKKFGYKPIRRLARIPRRVDLSGFAEFNPVFFARVGETVQKTGTLRLMWRFLLGAEAEGGEKQWQEVAKELASRFLPNASYVPDDFLPENVLNEHGLTMREVEIRRERAHAYSYYVERIWEDFQDDNDEVRLGHRLAEAIVDLDIALETYVVLFSGNREAEMLRGALWGLICTLTLTPRRRPRNQVVY